MFCYPAIKWIFSDRWLLTEISLFNKNVLLKSNYDEYWSQAGLPLELLYADDLILMAESEESLHDKIVKWKSGLEAKGLKMNTGKAKVMFSCSMKDKVEERGKWPCGVCKKGVCKLQ